LVSCFLRFTTIALTSLCAAGLLAAQDSTASTKKPSPKHSSHKRRKTTAKPAAAPAKGTPAKTSAQHRTNPAHQGAKVTSAKVTSAGAKSAKAKRAKVAHRSAQQQPTPERYKEIQQALADRGYFNGDVNGTWGPDSVDALKRFQREQNLTDDGKLGSLSLIALGLGPKRPDSTEKAAPQ